MNIKVLVLAAAVSPFAAIAQQPDAAKPVPPAPHAHHMMHHEMGGDDMMGGEPRSEWWKNPQVAARIGLTPDQIARLDDIKLKGQLEDVRLRAALEENELLLGPIVEGPTFDEHKAAAQIDKIADSRAALEKAMGKNMLALRSVLSPDQWTKLSAREQDHELGVEEGKVHHGPHGPKPAQAPPAPKQ